MISAGVCLLLTGFTVNEEEELPGTPTNVLQVSVNTLQHLSFGAFSHGNAGGTIVIDPNGVRSSTGDVIPLNMGVPYFPAIFEVEAPSGTTISIVNGPDIQLTGSNGGTMTLHVGDADPASPLVSTATPPAQNLVRIGATLTVGGPAENPPGTYSGSFSITFIQE